MGGNEQTSTPSGLAMSLSGNEPICPKFQPNVFDPSRCQECLRQRHLHSSSGETADAAAQQKALTEPENGTGTGTWTGPSRGGLLTPIQSQAEDRDTSSKVRTHKEGWSGERIMSAVSDGIS